MQVIEVIKENIAIIWKTKYLIRVVECIVHESARR
jgi:hypothetical protein